MPVITLIFSVGDGHESWWWEAAEAVLALGSAGIVAQKAWHARTRSSRGAIVGGVLVAAIVAAIVFHVWLPFALLAALGWQVWVDRITCTCG